MASPIRAIGALAVTALAASTVPACAVEDALSPYLKGATAFMAGFVPPQPGAYVTTTYYYYSGTATAEVRNGNVELGIDTTLNGGLLTATFVTDWKVLGGQYAFGVTTGYVGLGLDATISTGLGDKQVSLSNDGIADTIVTPVMLGWHDGNLHWDVAMSVYIPTGSYDTGGLSISKNVWGFFPQLGMTYFDPKSGWDVSGMLTYVTLTRNDATDYQSGDLLQFDWGVGKHFGHEGAWEIGVAGNLVEQIGPDTGSGAKLGPFKAESFGLGPALTYRTEVGHLPLNLGVRWEHDVAAHNTLDGDVVAVSATIVL
jgi:hypothetical protein